MSAMILGSHRLRCPDRFHLEPPVHAYIGAVRLCASVPKKSDGGVKASKPERRYALRREVARAVAAVQASGIPILTIDLCPDGTIRLSSGTAASPAGNSEFDAWEKAGKL